MRLTSAKQCLLIFFLFLSPEVFAQGMFEVLPTDKSLEYLGRIFGGNVGAIYLGGTSNPLLSRMFEKLNFIVVTFGVVILAYIGVAGAINTAREGEALGKKFSLWVPLRAMMGMLMMVPTPGTGYSAVQMTVMWFVLNGIGAANTIWGVVIDQLAQGTPATGGVSFVFQDTEMNALAGKVLRSATCMAYVNKIPNFTNQFGRVKIMTEYLPPVTTGPASAPTRLSQQAIVNVGVEKLASSRVDYSNICGSFTIDTIIQKSIHSQDAFNLASLLKRMYIKTNALLTMFSVLDSPANQFVTVPPTTVPPPPGAPTPPPPPPPTPPNVSSGYIPQAVNAFKNQIGNLAGGIKATAGSFTMEDLKSGVRERAGEGLVPMLKWEENYNSVTIQKNQINDLRKLGWIHAGGYYYALGKERKSDTDQDAVLPPVDKPAGIPKALTVPTPGEDEFFKTTIPPKESNWSPPFWSLLATKANREYLNYSLTFADAYATKDQTTSAIDIPALGSGKASTGSGFLDVVLTPMADGMRKPILKGIQESMGEGGDPLLKMGKMGWDMMVSAEAVLMGGMVLAAGILMIVSPGACLNPAPYSVPWLFSQLFVMLYILMALMWSIGATLGIYIPMVPYIIFTSTAVGWFVAVIEAVVAAPFIALALVQPSGEELGNIKQAIGILMNVFLKPSLMIFGFIIAASLLRAVISMINFGFIAAVDGSVIPSLFGIIPIIGLYAFFVIGMVNQSFSLIYELPSKVLRYCGMEDKGGYDPAKAAGEAKSGFQAGESVAGKEGAMGSMASKAGATSEKIAAKGTGPKKPPEGPGTSTPSAGDKTGGDKSGDSTSSGDKSGDSSGAAASTPSSKGGDKGGKTPSSGKPSASSSSSDKGGKKP